MLSPFVHWFVWNLYVHWIGWTLFALVVAGILLRGYAKSKKDRLEVATAWLTVAGLLIVFIFGILWIIELFMNDTLEHSAYLAHTQVNKIVAEPETTGFRFLPLSVAKAIATDKIGDSTAIPGEPEPFVEGDEVKWIVPREPNNMKDSWSDFQPGFLTISTTADDIQVDKTPYKPGFGLCCFGNSIRWAAIEHHFWGGFSPKPYPTNLDGETVIVQPYLTYFFDWSHYLPVMVKEWGGDVIFHADGSVEDLSAKEASSKYPSSRLFPMEMAEYFSESYPYKNGILKNLSFPGTHVDQPNVPHLGGTNDKNVSQFPFLIPTEDGPVWYTAVERHGSLKSADMSYYVNATTGEVSVHEFQKPLVGPDQAKILVDEAFNTLKSTSFVEPRPVVKNGKLYWMLSSPTSNSLDVRLTALVDSSSEEVIKLPNKQAVEQVVNGEDPHESGQVINVSSSSLASTSETTQEQSGENTMSDAERTPAGAPVDRLEKKGG